MDPIADMIIRMKNAVHAGREVVSVPQSGIKLAIAEKLKTRGYVTGVVSRGKKAGKVLELTLGRVTGGSFRFGEVKRVSKPGRRIYMGAHEIRTVAGGAGAVILSTPKGIMFGDEARKEHIGGEVLFEIW